MRYSSEAHHDSYDGEEQGCYGENAGDVQLEVGFLASCFDGLV